MATSHDVIDTWHFVLLKHILHSKVWGSACAFAKGKNTYFGASQFLNKQDTIPVKNNKQESRRTPHIPPNFCYQCSINLSMNCSSPVIVSVARQSSAGYHPSRDCRQAPENKPSLPSFSEASRCSICTICPHEVSQSSWKTRTWRFCCAPSASPPISDARSLVSVRWSFLGG